MRIFTYSMARKCLAEILDIALREEVIIQKRNGDTFSVVYKSKGDSPFDVTGIKTKAGTQDIINAVRESRAIQP